MKFINSIQLDLLKKHVGPFLFCFLTIMFLLLMQFLILHIDKLIGKDIPFSVILELILTNLAYMVVLAAPMAVLVATLMAFGKFSELNELTALRASGVNPFKVIAPVLVSSLILFISLVWFSNNVLPEANHKARSLFIDIRIKKPGFDLQPNSFYYGIDGYTFLVEDIDSKTDSLYGVVLFQEVNSDRDRAIIKADKGYLISEQSNTLSLYLYDGTLQSYSRPNSRTRTLIEKSNFKQHRITFDLADLAFERSDPNRRNRSDRTMNIQSMLVLVDSLGSEKVNQFKKASNLNFTLPKASEDQIQNEKQKLVSNILSDSSLSKTTSHYLIIYNQKSIIKQELILKNTISDLNNYKAALENTTTNITWRTKSINKYLVEIHKKFSIPFACLVFVLVGAPLGIMTRKGNFGVAAIISAVILTFYWIALIQGEKLADRLFISPFIGMWSFNIVLGVLGIYLTLRLTHGLKLGKLFSKNA